MKPSHRHPPAHAILAAILAACLPQPALAEEPELKEHHFEQVGVKAHIPAAWHVREDSEDGVVVYQITRERLDGAGAEYAVGLTLSVTPDIPSRAGIKPGQYAGDLLSFAVEDGGTVVREDKPPFSILRAEYSVDGDAGPVGIVDLAAANDTTGTLYFIAWQCPQSEADALAPLRDKILASFVFDPER
jgi:hypothetical protein